MEENNTSLTTSKIIIKHNKGFFNNKCSSIISRDLLKKTNKSLLKI